MNVRVRSILLGVGLGIAPILLLDLARTLRDSHDTDPTATSFWWVLACYVITGAISALGLMLAARDRLLAAVALAVLVFGVTPWTPVSGLAQLGNLPLLPLGSGGLDAIGIGFALIGAYAYVLVRGNRA